MKEEKKTFCRLWRQWKPSVDFASEKKIRESSVDFANVTGAKKEMSALQAPVLIHFLHQSCHLHETSLPRKLFFILLFLRQKWTLNEDIGPLIEVSFSEGTSLTSPTMVEEWPLHFLPISHLYNSSTSKASSVYYIFCFMSSFFSFFFNFFSLLLQDSLETFLNVFSHLPTSVFLSLFFL